MAKKNKHHIEGEAPTTETAATTPAGTENAQPEAFKRPSSHLVMDTADLLGRTSYRFTKCKEMPKKAGRIPITVDGIPCEMAVTSAAGYQATPAHNGYLTKPDGSVGWIIFNDNVDPTSVEQFPNGINFTTTEGLGEANPVRVPKNPEGEQKRRAAAAESLKLRQAAKAEQDAADAAAAAAAAEAQGEPVTQ